LREIIQIDFDATFERTVKVAYDRLSCCDNVALSTSVCLVLGSKPP
jgi:hypothetical protein